ncbi:unnamed protein product [Rhizoctonia solani]|uniref:Uncharacterized protein n=1 Tax=Rhizoctonia solani TaxID=456999 RepID=A0A8H3D2Y1_9AGAM|nr:unnamed protein product [Rhizoctonia solani]
MPRSEPVKKACRTKAQPKVNHEGKLTFVTAAQSRADKEAWLREHQTGYKRMEHNPPTYDVAVGSSTGSTAPPAPTSPTLKSKDTPYAQSAPQPHPHNGMIVAPSLVPGPTVYRFHNPQTGEIVSSLLPPDVST